jgi:glycosyltransferase involved in cell wall biosynthesis
MLSTKPLIIANQFTGDLLKANRLSSPVRITEQVWPEGMVPVVTILCPTYSHVNFIRDAIEGFLIQETTFPVEIIVRDDASSDGTAEIVRDYQEKYPQLIVAILHKENQYSKGKKPFPETYAMARGEFVAFCEGDDYWTDPKKLEIQFEYLTQNPDCVGCFHQSRLVDESRKILRENLKVFVKHKYNRIEAFQELQSSYATNSLLFRNQFQQLLPDWFLKKPNDMALEVLLTTQGNLGFIDRNMSDYRKHSGGVWSQKSPEMQNFELMHRFQLWIDDKEFPEYLKYYCQENICKLLEYNNFKYELVNLSNQVEHFKSIIKLEKNNLELIKNSISWKVTKPLRKIHNFLLKITGREYFDE